MCTSYIFIVKTKMDSFLYILMKVVHWKSFVLYNNTGLTPETLHRKPQIAGPISVRYVVRLWVPVINDGQSNGPATNTDDTGYAVNVTTIANGKRAVKGKNAKSEPPISVAGWLGVKRRNLCFLLAANFSPLRDSLPLNIFKKKLSKKMSSYIVTGPALCCVHF